MRTMPQLIFHGFLAGKSLFIDAISQSVNSNVNSPNTIILPEAEYTHVCITWDALIIVKDGKVGLRAGFPSPSVILNTGGLDQLPTEEPLALIVESWSHRFCLDKKGHCFSSYKDCKEWQPVQNQNGDVEEFVSVCCGETQTVGITANNKGCVFLKNKESGCFVTRPLCLGFSIRSVSCGKEHILLLTTIGVVLSCGSGSRGQLGNGGIENIEEPQIIQELEGLSVVAIAAGGWHSAAVSDIGDVYTWGWNESGQLGFPCRKTQEALGKTMTDDDCVNVQCLPAVVDLPVTSDNVKVIDVSCGSRHTAVVTDDGELFTWGWNQYGQLGHGDIIDRDTPTLVHYGENSKHLCDKSTHDINLRRTGLESSSEGVSCQKFKGGKLSESEEGVCQQGHVMKRKMYPESVTESMCDITSEVHTEAKQVQGGKSEVSSTVTYQGELSVHEKSVEAIMFGSLSRNACGNTFGHGYTVSTDEVQDVCIKSMDLSQQGLGSEEDLSGTSFSENLISSVTKERKVQNPAKVKKVFCGGWSTLVELD